MIYAIDILDYFTAVFFRGNHNMVTRDQRRSVTKVPVFKGFPDQDVFVGIVADAGEWTVDLGLGPWAWLII